MNYYLDCINYEVYNNQRLNPVAKYKIRTFNPAKNAVYLLRKYQYHINEKGFYHNAAAKLYYKKLFSTYNIFIRSTTKIEKGLSLPHPTGIIFGEYAEIGKNCTIYQNVTIGAKVRFEYKLKKYPHIGG